MMDSLPIDSLTSFMQGASSRPALLPLSFAQQRLWFLDQLQPGSTLYHAPFVLRLSGALHLPALHLSLQHMIARHEILRTRFPLDPDTAHPIQQILPPGPCSLPLLDLGTLPADARTPTAQRLARQAIGRPFDLACGPLVRVTLLRLDAHEHWLLLCLHHIVIDHWGYTVLLREWSTLYQAAIQGHPAILPDLPLHYADFALWQRQWLTGQTLADLRAYWHQQLAGAPQVFDLPFARPRPPVQRFQGAVLSFTLPEDLSPGLRRVSQRAGVTLYMTLLAAWQVLLARYSGQTDFLLGSSIANRQQEELEHLVGFFANTLVIRADLRGDPTFAQLVQRVRQTCVQAYAHQDWPFEQLVEDLHPGRDPGRTPLVQIMFAFLNQMGTPAQFAGLQSTRLSFEREITKFDLSVALAERAGELHGSVEYSTDLFEPAQMQRLLEHYQRLLAAVVADPQAPISRYQFLSPTEREQALARARGPLDQGDPDLLSPALFLLHAERTPDTIALVCADLHLSYHALARHASVLASHLRSLHCGPAPLLALALHRTPLWLLSLLASWLAGAIYLPLDPSSPPARLRSLLQQCPPTLLLTSPDLLSAFSDLDLPCLCPQDLLASPDLPEPLTLPTPHPASLAYQLFTSGSTGEPKAVLLSHRSLANLAIQQGRRLHMRPGHRVLQWAAASFDASLSEIVLALLHGATLCLPDASGPLVGPALHATLERLAITTLTLPPSALPSLSLADLPHLHHLLLAGEAWTASLLSSLSRTSHPDLHIFNAYGPSEACVCASMSRWLGETHPVLGEPLGLTQLYVLAPGLHPTPPGGLGEIVLGGMGLAHGYAGRPELTAERFVPDPFSEQPGRRLYRTGDLGLVGEDGRVIYRGRSDQQVKLRGYRIEPGEVEHALRAQEGVREAVVVVQGEGERRQLVAYVQGEIALERLRAGVGQRLPGYLQPGRYLVCTHWPLTSSGKVDRQALARGWHEAHEEVETEAEETEEGSELEQRVAAIWREVLGVKRVGLQESFFEVGGHSLLAVRLLARVRSVLSVDLGLDRFFEDPTIAGLARTLDDLLSHTPEHSTSLLAPGPRPALLPLSFAQQRLWFLDQLQPGSTLYHAPFVLRLSGTLHLPALHLSLQHLIARHEILRTRFPLDPDTTHPIQQILPAGPCSLPLLDLGALPADARTPTAQRLARQAIGHPFDLACEPPVRVTLLRLDAHEHWLLLCLHHIIIDQQGHEVLLREWSALYQAAIQGHPAILPDLPLHYADFALWQRQWLSGQTLADLRAYWHQQLAGAPQVFDLPFARPRPPVQRFQGATLPFVLPEDLSLGLRRVSQHAGVTLYMTLLAAWQILLARYSGQTDFLLGSPIANRQQEELEHLVGFFANTLVIRADLRGDPSFAQLVQRVRQTCVQAYAHQDWPFEQLVEDLHPGRDPGRTPLVQIMFSFQAAPSAGAQFAGLQSTRLPLVWEISKFDLSLSLTETGQGLRGDIEYSTDLFEPARMQRLLEHYQRLLAAVVANPQTPISGYRFLGRAEVQYLVETCNRTQTDYPRDICVQTLVEQQVARTPDAIALVDHDQHVSYRMLERRANALAAVLRQQGVGPEVLVGLCLERSLELPIGLLGILKAGGAYLPLDPEYPRERLGAMLQDARVSVILTRQNLRELLPATGATVLCLDTLRRQAEVEREHCALTGVRPGHAVSVIYTSGSTGQPKGVVNIHGGLVNRLCWMQRTYRLTPGERVLQKTPVSFDVSAWEFFWTLGTGATLVLARPQGHRDSAYLVQTMAEQAITTIHFVPAMLTALLEERGLETLHSLQRIFCSGEALPAPVLQRACQRLGADVQNLYGPTEASIDVTSWACTPGADVVPIGKPIANTTLYVLDAHLHLAPEGIPAGLYIGGVGLARGYLHRPDLTAERFLPDPFSQIPGSRLYRSGDVVRYLPDGDLEFLGREDQQVKIRGNRVEPGEVEVVLGEHPAVREAIVLVRTDAQGEPCLACYLSACATQQPTGVELRAYLLARLPAYMVPASYIWLERMPLTASGKVDRRALAALSLAPASHPHRLLPRTHLEQHLARIWQEALNVEEVGIHENFFDLGGHSLLLIRVHKQVQALARQQIPFIEMFRYPTIGALADYLEQQQEEDPVHSQQRGRARRELRAQQWRRTARSAASEE